MKKIWLVSLAFCGLFSLSMARGAFACIGADGSTVEGTDGVDVKNCSGAVVEPTETKEVLDISTGAIDFGYFSEVGKSYTQTFTITNQSDAAVKVRLTVERPENDKINEDSMKAADWLVFVGGVRLFELAGNSSKTIGVRVVVPSDAKHGSQYAVIKVEDVTNESSKKLDVRMTVATDGVAFGGTVTNNVVLPINISDHAEANITVKNNGNAGFVAKYAVRVTPRFGLEEWKDVAELSQEVYPGSEVDFSISDKEIGYGFYTVEQKIIYVNDKGEQVEEISKRTVLNLPLWVLLVAGGLVILLIVLIIVICAIKKKSNGGHVDKKEKKNGMTIKTGKGKKHKKTKDDDNSADSVDMKV